MTISRVGAAAAVSLTLLAGGAASPADAAPAARHAGAAAASYDAQQPRTGITRIDITSSGVAFGGRTFGAFGMVGTYEKLRGKAYGELDPRDPRNAVITDLRLAPRNARGMVEYSTDIYILKPTDLAKGNHKVFMEVNNRGGKLSGSLNGSPITNDPVSAEDAGEAFLMDQGYTLVWSGWDPAALPANNGLTIQVPVAKRRNGRSITGPSYEYISFDAPTSSATLSYPAASLDESRATLTVKDHLTDEARVIPSSGWAFTSPTTIGLLPAGTPFEQSSIYELTYRAKDPTVNGIGFAATRDVLSFLRHKVVDAHGNRNPLAGDVSEVLGYAISQPARYLNDFLWLGFNEDLAGRKVFDGIENWIGGGTGVALNYRFGQPERTERIRQQHLYPEAPFPFSYNTLTDPVTGRRDGRNRSCSRTGTCPKVMSVNSSNEYWSKAASLLHTDPTGRRDVVPPANVRYYLISSTEHAVVGNPPDSRGTCAQPRNTIDPTPVERALFVALDRWVSHGVQPPASRVPTLASGTLARVQVTQDSPVGVGVVPQGELGWPSIPGVTYTGTATVRNLYDFGPRSARGILDVNPPRATGVVYPSYVPKVDADGNEIAGIRVPDVAAPTATYTGWGVRADEYGGPDACEGSGQTIALPRTAAERAGTGDPRRSVAERYGSHEGYVAAVKQAAERLVEEGFLLPQDAAAYVTRAETSDVLR